MSGWTIPATHDAEVRDALARWRVLRKAGSTEWDAGLGGSRFRPPEPPAYAPLIDELRATGRDPFELRVPAHDEVLKELYARAGEWSRPAAAAAFVAGLWSAPAAWRSPLLGVLLADEMPPHPLTEWSDTSVGLCRVCGFRTAPEHTITEWGFRLTEGTPLDGVPTGYAQVLGWLGSARPVPTEYDRWALGALLAVLRAQPAGTRSSAAAKSIGAAGILRGRRTSLAVLEALALAGVLAPEDRPGLAERFTTYREREDRPSVRVEVQAPLAWWSTDVGDHGVRREVFAALFDGLDIPVVDLDAPRPERLPAAKDTVDGGAAARARAFTPRASRPASSVGSGPVEAGDVWAIRLAPGRWVTAYVHAVEERGRPYAQLEFLAGVFAEQPGAEEIGTRVQPRYDGRWVMWGHSLEKTPWVRRIAQRYPEPEADAPLPDRGGWQAASALRRLAPWCFPES